MTTEKLTKEQAERIEKIIVEINSSFAWVGTREGMIYWEKICNGLKRIAENGLKNNEKKSVINAEGN